MGSLVPGDSGADAVIAGARAAGYKIAGCIAGRR